MGWISSCLARSTSCRHLGHPAGVSGARQVPYDLTHIALSGVSGGGGDDDTCLLHTSLVETLAEAQDTLLELPNLFSSGCTQISL